MGKKVLYFITSEDITGVELAMEHTEDDEVNAVTNSGRGDNGREDECKIMNRRRLGRATACRRRFDQAPGVLDEKRVGSRVPTRLEMPVIERTSAALVGPSSRRRPGAPGGEEPNVIRPRASLPSFSGPLRARPGRTAGCGLPGSCPRGRRRSSSTARWPDPREPP